MINNDLQSKKNFGEQLKRAIRLAGETQSTLAKKLGISPRTMSTWCNDHDRPSKKEIAGIQAILKIEIMSLNPIDDKIENECPNCALLRIQLVECQARIIKLIDERDKSLEQAQSLSKAMKKNLQVEALSPQ
jgi:transcriptional regulator with XRE-family HTH domain